MLMGMNDETEKKTPKQKERDVKDERIAKALRDNLRRRKAAARKSKP